MSKDSDFIRWLRTRMVVLYSENPNADYMHRLQKLETKLFDQERAAEQAKLNFEEAMDVWIDHDDCQYADKKAEWWWFFEHGMYYMSGARARLPFFTGFVAGAVIVIILSYIKNLLI